MVKKLNHFLCAVKAAFIERGVNEWESLVVVDDWRRHDRFEQTLSSLSCLAESVPLVIHVCRFLLAARAREAGIRVCGKVQKRPVTDFPYSTYTWNRPLPWGPILGTDIFQEPVPVFFLLFLFLWLRQSCLLERTFLGRPEKERGFLVARQFIYLRPFSILGFNYSWERHGGSEYQPLKSNMHSTACGPQASHSIKSMTSFQSFQNNHDLGVPWAFDATILYRCFTFAKRLSKSLSSPLVYLAMCRWSSSGGATTPWKARTEMRAHRQPLTSRWHQLSRKPVPTSSQKKMRLNIPVLKLCFFCFEKAVN